MGPKVLISAGEASGDLYAARLAEHLRRSVPGLECFGCAGPRMRQAGVRAVISAEDIAVVGLAEVIVHIPRIYKRYRRLLAAARTEKPDLAILTDSPDFHLRLAGRLKRLGIPVIGLVAPQVWAWRPWRIRAIRRNIDRLLCIFPFEEEFFRRRGVRAEYIGHPLAHMIRPSTSRAEFFQQHGLPQAPLITLLPGSRTGEIRRHFGPLLDAAVHIHRSRPAGFVVALPPGLPPAFTAELRRRAASFPVVIAEGVTWDAIAHADLALAASGTVTIEAALLGTPLVAFYRVAPLSWWLGRPLVRVPFFSMVNLVAGRRLIPELMQNEVRGERLAEEALRLLGDPEALARIRQELRTVAAQLSPPVEAMRRASSIVQDLLLQGALHAK
ncbi:MAG TPA: lipid-A-disaccharide synthase [Bryobacteraceae bacterium]|nr:lipid-A-disaccharide synthase [Bryobacteraceae bacterium]